MQHAHSRALLSSVDRQVSYRFQQSESSSSRVHVVFYKLLYANGLRLSSRFIKRRCDDDDDDDVCFGRPAGVGRAPQIQITKLSNARLQLQMKK